MNAILKRSACALMVAVVVVGCTKDDPESDPKPTPATTPTPDPTPSVAPTPEPTTNLVPENPSGTGPQARVKSEVDGKDPDPGTRGPTLSAGKVTYAAAQGWTAGKSGVWSTATATDSKAGFAAGALGAGESSVSKLPDAAGALGYTECQWGTAESVTVGKDRLPGTAADGTCKQGGATVKTAYVAVDSLSALAVGGWAEGGDATGVFSTFRHAKKVGGGSGDSTGIAACCAALAQNANSAPPEQKGAYIAAAAACRSVINNPQGRAALAQARALLAGANVPSSCR